MTEEIRNSIEVIRARVMHLHQELVLERERGALMQDELNRLQSELKTKEEEVSGLKLESVLLREKLNELEAIQQISSNSQSTDRAIDSLVREIDFCIQQLKLSHE